MSTVPENEQILQPLAGSSGGECGCGHQRPSDLDAPREVPAQ